ncbi:Uncharacterized protein TCM_012310 [Theobroma cacao]|uniref:Uncharacterized protein n=1 Tax=Theobroma cacao TaxID=3641 RepID=A0A061FVT8_THECC|nr:Uncharacterized protein TCM_012310 [Theobroma cacao]
MPAVEREKDKEPINDFFFLGKILSFGGYRLRESEKTSEREALGLVAGGHREGRSFEIAGERREIRLGGGH